MARRIIFAVVSLIEVVLSLAFLLALVWMAACRSTWPDPIRAEVRGAYTTKRIDGSEAYWLELAWENEAGHKSARKQVTFSEYIRFSTRAEVCLYELGNGDVVLRSCP
jgi:hypothetical protein